MPRINEIVRTSAAEAVRRRLVSLIRSGAFEVGDKLPPEQELARQFGVSRPVIREALGSLRVMGLVASYPGRGSFVTSADSRRSGHLLLGRYSAESLHEVRSHVEIPGARLAARRRTEEHLVRLREVVEELESCNDPERWVELDAAFHIGLAEATENSVQTRLVEAFRDLHVEQSLALASVEGRIDQANHEHRAIYEAVAAQDEEAAERAMGEHLHTVEVETSALPPGELHAAPGKHPDERRGT